MTVSSMGVVIQMFTPPDVQAFPAQGRPTCAMQTLMYSEVKQLAFKSHFKTQSNLSSAAGCSECGCRVCRLSRLWAPRERRVHLSKEMSVIHVKWPAREPSHLLAETWNGKHAVSPGAPQALLLPRKWNEERWSKHVNPGGPQAWVFHNSKSICRVEVLGMSIGIYRDRLTSRLLPGFHSHCYGNKLFHWARRNPSPLDDAYLGMRGTHTECQCLC